MLWKLFGLQKKLDALFDDGWVTLGLSSGRSGRLPQPVVEYPGE